jgi:hypothetical protein
MSLLTFVNEPDIKAILKERFKKPRTQESKPLLAPPLTDHWGLVGTSFDYLLRFYLQTINPKSLTNKWVAYLALDKIEDFDDKQMLDKGKEILRQAETRHSKYLDDEKITDELISSVLQLAQ